MFYNETGGPSLDELAAQEMVEMNGLGQLTPQGQQALEESIKYAGNKVAAGYAPGGQPVMGNPNLVSNLITAGQQAASAFMPPQMQQAQQQMQQQAMQPLPSFWSKNKTWLVPLGIGAAGLAAWWYFKKRKKASPLVEVAANPRPKQKFKWRRIGEAV